MSFYDALETRSADQRAADLARDLPAQIARAQGLSGNASALAGVQAASVTDMAGLAGLPVLRKSALVEGQTPEAPLGGYAGPIAAFFRGEREAVERAKTLELEEQLERSRRLEAEAEAALGERGVSVA